MELRYLALDEESDLRRVEAAGKVIQCYLNDVLTHLLRVIGIVCECLNVCDEHKHAVIVALVLKEHAVTQ